MNRSKKPLKEQVKITFRGWPGHFCCSADCIFRLNTLIEYGDIHIVVSTVGMMRSPWKKGSEFYKGEYDTIGINRYYETMAFHASFDGKFWDANGSQINFDSEWAYEKLDSEREANDGHYAVIEEIKNKLLAGEKFEIKD